MRNVNPAMLAAIIFSSFSTLFAQQKNTAMIEFGFGTGTTVYQGDLAKGPLGLWKTITPNFQFYVAKTLNSSFAVRANMTLGTITADESKMSNPSWKQQRNFFFSTRINEFTAQIVFNPMGTYTAKYTPRLTPYVFGGLGINFIDVTKDASNASAAFTSDTKFANGLAIDNAAGTPKAIIALPIGFGVQYAITSKIALYTEASYRMPVSDYIDGFSRSANSTNKDNFYNIQVGMHFKLFNKRTGCPPVKW